jgi:hypothetical protein
MKPLPRATAHGRRRASIPKLKHSVRVLMEIEVPPPVVHYDLMQIRRALPTKRSSRSCLMRASCAAGLAC